MLILISLATGESLIGLTEIVTTEILLSNKPSFALNANVSVPYQLAFGV